MCLKDIPIFLCGHSDVDPRALIHPCHDPSVHGNNERGFEVVYSRDNSRNCDWVGCGAPPPPPPPAHAQAQAPQVWERVDPNPDYPFTRTGYVNRLTGYGRIHNSTMGPAFFHARIAAETITDANAASTAGLSGMSVIERCAAMRRQAAESVLGSGSGSGAGAGTGSGSGSGAGVGYGYRQAPTSAPRDAGYGVGYGAANYGYNNNNNNAASTAGLSVIERCAAMRRAAAESVLGSGSGSGAGAGSGSGTNANAASTAGLSVIERCAAERRQAAESVLGSGSGSGSRQAPTSAPRDAGYGAGDGAAN
jgi:hypothetical protein